MKAATLAGLKEYVERALIAHFGPDAVFASTLSSPRPRPFRASREHLYAFQD